MKANDIDLHEFLTTGRNYIIPVYQRNYDWKKEHCEKLLQDIIKADTQNLPEYFLGSIVITLRDKSSYNEYFIIDGQQRLTTLMLLLLAIYHNDSEIAKGTRAGIEKLIFYNIHNQEKRLILKQIQKDDEFLSKIIKGAELTDDNSNIINNYLYFKNEIANSPEKIVQIMSGFNTLRIVQINLNEKNDNPQLVFETLNATGKELSEADKIRNYILMYKKDQEKLYEDYWVKIEDNCLQKNNEHNISTFIKCFLTIEYIDKISKPIKDDKVYNVFKEYLEEKDNEEILKLMLSYSKSYNLILNSNENSKDRIDGVLYRIRRNINVTVLDPLLLYILKKNKDENISDDIAFQMIFLIENYLLRRAICSIPSNALNKIVISMIKKIVDKYTEIEMKEAFEQSLFYKNNNFPTDTDVLKSIKTRKLYSSSAGVLGNFLLKQLETFNSKEKNRYEEISIEHIMPQTLTDKWKEELGDKYQFVYDTYLHTLGNITLTGYNSELSNQPFENKKEEILKKSKFKFLNEDIVDVSVSKWNEKEILKRTNRLANALLEIYSYPENINTDLESDNIIEIDIIEDIDYDYTSKEILEYEYNNKNHKVLDKSWSTFMVDLLGEIYEEDTVKFNASIIENQIFTDKIRHEQFQEKYVHNKYYKASNGKVLYFNTVQDTNSKIRLINSIFEILDIDDAVTVKIKNKNS